MLEYQHRATPTLRGVGMPEPEKRVNIDQSFHQVRYLGRQGTEDEGI